MLADMHAHYPMRVVSDLTPRTTLDRMKRIRGQPGVKNKLRALLLKIASMLGSDRDWWSGYRITVDKMDEGGVGFAMSVLYRPEAEIGPPHASPPEPGYFDSLLEDLEAVEAEVATHDPGRVRLVHNRAELDACVQDGAIALVHCVEGGVHLGDSKEEIERNVATLAKKGVVYVTVGHLFFRQVATAAPAIPFLRWDWVYNLLFPQPDDEGLTERGRNIVEALVKHRILVDLSHMSEDSMRETFSLLDQLDDTGEMPVISSHAGFHFGGQEYMLERWAVDEIKKRDGVIGLIMAQYQLNDGLRKTDTTDRDESFEVIRRHIDELAGNQEGRRHVALGTDFDGFIKPTMGGLEDMGDLRFLEEWLRAEYPADADGMASGNALRVVRKLWA
jgi:microsomal dipeptidase-like Zn-dependent dipeptidase